MQLNRNTLGKSRIGWSLAQRGFLLVGLGCLLSIARAVTPAPDGGYPNQNTAEGDSALNSFNVSNFFGSNTAIGWEALFSDVNEIFNTAVGAGALFSNTAGDNTAVGANSLGSNTSGTANTATGLNALGNNTIGSSNTATGLQALQVNTTGNANTAVGLNALNLNNGSDNTAVGFDALNGSTSGEHLRKRQHCHRLSSVAEQR
jgi:hypothetical protein